MIFLNLSQSKIYLCSSCVLSFITGPRQKREVFWYDFVALLNRTQNFSSAASWYLMPPLATTNFRTFQVLQWALHLTRFYRVQGPSWTKPWWWICRYLLFLSNHIPRRSSWHGRFLDARLNKLPRTHSDWAVCWSCERRGLEIGINRAQSRKYFQPCGTLISMRKFPLLSSCSCTPLTFEMFSFYLPKNVHGRKGNSLDKIYVLQVP